MEIGKHNRLTVVREVDFGVYLDGEEAGEILMPASYVPEGCKPGDTVDVFVYTDSEDRLVATTETPLVEAGGIAALKVKAVTDFGAFLDWGLQKDLLLPYSEQRRDVAEGDTVVVYAYLDNISKRMTATTKWERNISTETEDLAEGDKCEILVAGTSPLGIKAVVNGRYSGLLYKDEAFVQLKTGDKLNAYIRKIREDGKIDLSLSPIGYRKKIGGDTDNILTKLKDAGGFLPTTDKSPAEQIYATYGISKKAYKQAVGHLYKQRLIQIDKDGIRINGKS